MRRVASGLAVVAAALFVACTDQAPPKVVSVAVSPTAGSALVGESVAFTAAARDEKGSVLNGRNVTWQSSAPNVATVANGIATAVGAGTTTISATIEGIVGSAQFTVHPPVASVEITPAVANLAVGATATLVATTRDAVGGVLANRPVSWSSSSSATATVSSGGVVTVVAFGPPVTITATAEGRSGTASITIVPPVASVTVAPATTTLSPGGSTTLTAVARDANGNVLSGRATQWISSDASIATVTMGPNLTGVVTAVSPGTTTIRAVAEDRVGIAQVTVTAAPVVLTGVTMDQDSIPIGNVALELWQGNTSVAAFASDAAGRFSRPGVIPGAFEIRGRRFGYENVSVPVTVTAAATPASVLLRLESRPVAGVVRATRVSRVGSTFVFEADIFVTDARGQSVALDPTALSLPTNSWTFDQVSLSSHVTPTSSSTTTLLSIAHTASIFSADSARYRLRLARSLARQASAGAHLLAIGGFGANALYPARWRVLANGFTSSGLSLFPAIDSLEAPVTGTTTFESSHPGFLNYIIANSPASTRALVLLSDGDYSSSGATTLLSQFSAQGVAVHTVALTPARSAWDDLARMAVRGNGISMPITDFRQLEAARQTLPLIVRGGLPFYRLRWTSIGSATATIFIEELRIQLAGYTISLPLSFQL